MRIEDLRRRLAGACERLGLSAADAGGLAELLLDSELRGHGDHGVAALGLLRRLYGSGELNPRPSVSVVRETDGMLVLDGDHGCGPAAPERAMRWCIEHARGRGMACAVIRDWQMIVGAPWVRMAAEAGMIGFACTNFIPLVAPPGGRTPVLGTNPLAYGLPGDPPVVLDVATSVVALQKVRVAAAEGRSLPEGLIFDGDGLPSTDPNEFASLAPLGSPFAPHKGFGLALFVEALTGVLGGGDPGVFLWATEVDAGFRPRMDALVERVKAAGGTLPGESGERRRREHLASAEVPLSAAVRALLEAG